MRAAAGAILLIAWTFPVAAAEGAGPADTLARIEAQLVQSPILRASFEQERRMRVLKRPLLSRGRLTAVAGRGVLWQVRAPHAATVLVSADAILEWDDQGPPRRMGMTASPVFGALGGALLDVLTGDPGQLATLFEVTPLPAKQGWRLALAPKDPNLAAMITGLEIAGGRFVEKVVISEAGGDRTVITFGDFRTEPGALEASEQAYFEH
jgi:Outer membrane lipoprotein carrier protein LolA-like